MKNSLFALSALAGAAVASPLTAVGMDFGQISAASSIPVTAQVPPVVATVTSTYAEASAIGAASTGATAAVTQAVKVKRNYNPLCMFFGNCYAPTSTSCTKKTTSTTSSYTTTGAGSPTGVTTTAAATTSSSSSSAAAAATTTTTPTTTATCTPLPTGAGTTVNNPDTAEAFESYAQFASDALSVATPSGYMNSFKNSNASNVIPTYLTYITLNTYDPSICATACTANALCQGFNLYYERDPTLDANGASCQNPPSTTMIKCSMYGSNVNSTTATNDGQWRGQFHVVIAGSNGYNKIPTTSNVPSANTGSGSSSNTWGTGTRCPKGSAIARPGYLMGQKFFPGPFDPNLCSAFAAAQVAINKRSANIFGFYQPCNSFNAYTVVKDGSQIGTYCSLFTTTSITNKYATYCGGNSGSSVYTIEESILFTAQTIDNGNIYW